MHGLLHRIGTQAILAMKNKSVNLMLSSIYFQERKLKMSTIQYRELTLNDNELIQALKTKVEC